MPKQSYKMVLFKAIVLIDDEPQEVPVWASSLDEAHEAAALEYGEVQRVRPTVVPE